LNRLYNGNDMNTNKVTAPIVSIIIPNLNGMKFLPACLSSLHNQTFRAFEVIVVDNASTDESVGFVRTRFPDTVLIENKLNMGFAEANNQGIRAAQGKYIATLNNDTEADRDWLATLIDAAEQSAADVGMWAPKILSLQHRNTIDSVGGLLIYRDGIAKGRGRLEDDTGQYDGVRRILLPSACCALYRKIMLDETGYFDSDFFAYCEDTDLGLRALYGGWKAVSVPSSIVYHYYSGTGGVYSQTKAFLVERNHLWVAWKCFPAAWNIMLPFYCILRYVIQLYGAVSNRGSAARFVKDHSLWDGIITIIRAYGAAIKGLPSIVRKRRSIRKRITGEDFTAMLKQHQISAGGIALID